MDNPRPEKVAVVDEVRARLDAADGRHPHRVPRPDRGARWPSCAGRLRGGGRRLQGLQEHPGASWPSPAARHEPLDAAARGPDGDRLRPGDVSAVAKALRDFARTEPDLVVKGGVLGEGVPVAAGPGQPSPTCRRRDVLLARFAGAIAAPLRQLAGLLQALPRNLAYGLSALIDQQGGARRASRPGRRGRRRRAGDRGRPTEARGRGRPPPRRPTPPRHRRPTAPADRDGPGEPRPRHQAEAEARRRDRRRRPRPRRREAERPPTTRPRHPRRPTPLDRPTHRSQSIEQERSTPTMAGRP